MSEPNSRCPGYGAQPEDVNATLLQPSLLFRWAFVSEDLAVGKTELAVEIGQQFSVLEGDDDWINDWNVEALHQSSREPCFDCASECDHLRSVFLGSQPSLSFYGPFQSSSVLPHSVHGEI